VSANSHGGAGRGQGRKPLAEPVTTKCFTLFERQAGYTSEQIRSIIDRHEVEYNREWVTLWEDNAGGLWLVDTARAAAWSVGSSNFVADASDLWIGQTDAWETDSHPYAEAVEQQDGIKLVAEYSNGEAKFYPEEMGSAATEYCFKS
jgi:hypothetical protein